MGNTPFFLYNYAVELDRAGKKDESLAIAKLCDEKMANYDLELLLGDLCRDTEMLDEAERHYRRASAMCPCRFVPLNQLYDLYMKQDDRESALRVAEETVSKTVKVKSRTVTQIRYKMRRALTEQSADPY